ncbi:MAG: hypothetical protein ACP6IY_19225 [Promethearchaeia archaeon]
MDYNEITERLLRRVLEEFNLIEIYQEFLDSLVEFNDFKNINKEEFQKYLNSLKI